jgi:hypothetical protein
MVTLGGITAQTSNPMTMAWIAHSEGTPVSLSWSRGGRFQDFLANIVGQQSEDKGE